MALDYFSKIYKRYPAAFVNYHVYLQCPSKHPNNFQLLFVQRIIGQIQVARAGVPHKSCIVKKGYGFFHEPHRAMINLRPPEYPAMK